MRTRTRTRETGKCRVVRYRRGEGLDQVEAPAVADLADAPETIGRVVDRVGQLIAANSGVVRDEGDVEDETLPDALFFLEGSVKAAGSEPRTSMTTSLTCAPPRAAFNASTC